MAQIIIDNMDMPETCDTCLSGFVKTIGCTKRQFFDDRATKRHPECPLHYLAEHGDLIDRNSFFSSDMAYTAPELWNDGNYIVEKLYRARVIIPANKENNT